MVRLAIIAIVMAVLSAQSQGAVKIEGDLLKQDLAMAAEAAKTGMVRAIETRLISNSRLMAQGPMEPMEGKTAILNGLKKLLADGTTLNWTPEHAVNLSDGHSGYTIGRYVMVSPPKPPKPRDKAKAAKLGLDTRTMTASEPRKRHGHYATLWVRDTDGQWRIALTVTYRGRKPK